MPPIPDGCVLLLTGTRKLTRPWGCGRLSNLKPILVIHGGANGADTVAGEFFGKVAPVEVIEPDWSKGKGAGIIRNGVMLEHAQTRARELGATVYGLALWNGSSPGTQNMIGRLNRANIPHTILHQLPPSIDDWSEDLREELYSISGQYINDRIKSLIDPVTDDLKQKADSFAEGVIRSEYAWRQTNKQ